MLKPAILKFVIALCFSALAACSDPPPIMEGGLSPGERYVVCKPSIQPFWTEFRNAVLKEDWETVAGLTEYPLTVHGLGVKHISRKEFAKQFPQFLDAPLVHDYPGIKPKPVSTRELIKAVPTLHKKACRNSEERLVFERWEFSWRVEGWRLSRIDIDKFPASMKHFPSQPLIPDYSHLRCKPSVHPFWKKFRDAILKEDWETVAGLTEFPLIVHGYGRKHISRKEFVEQFPQFLNATLVYGYPGVEPKPASMRALIKAVPTLHKDACGDFEEMLSFERWDFGLTLEDWRLGVIRVDEFPASMKHIPIQPR